MIVMSRYTAGYADDARRLQRSCATFGLNSDITCVKSEGDWRTNERKKANWILQRVADARQSVLWLDADCEIMHMPTLLCGTGADFAIYNWKADIEVCQQALSVVSSAGQLLCSAGVMLFGYTAPAMELLLRWMTLIQAVGDMPTDPLLDRAFNQHRPPVNHLWLPRAYNRMRDQFPDDVPVIDHHNDTNGRLAYDEGGDVDLVLFTCSEFYDQVVDGLPNNFRAVEVGSWLGDSAIYFCKKVGWKVGTLYCVDTWKGTPGEELMQETLERYGGDLHAEFVKRIEVAQVDRRIKPMRMSSVAAAAEFEDESLDFVMIDADHSEAAVAADIQAWWPKVKPGGLLAGDDYQDKEHPGVTVAVKARFDGQVEQQDRVWCVRKPALALA